MASQKAKKTILQRLEEYGDTYLEEENRNLKQGKKKKKHKQKQHIQNTTDSDTGHNVSVVPRKKKKKLKKTLNLIKNPQNGDIVKGSRNAVVCKKMKWLKETLGGEVFDLSAESVKDATSDQPADVQKKKEPEVIVFEDPTRKRKRDPEGSTDTSNTKGLNLFDMKKARFEVRKLGISGFAREQKSEARTSLLLSLGAEPPKNKTYINYKEFQQKRKAEIDAEKANTDQQGSSTAQRKEKTTKKSQKRSRDKNDVGDLDGQVGHYRNGVQFIGKEVIKKLKSSR